VLFPKQTKTNKKGGGVVKKRSLFRTQNTKKKIKKGTSYYNVEKKRK